MKTTCLIHSIYLATEGEGVHLGIPQVFVRFQGCLIGCVNCDSMDTWKFDESKRRDLESVLREIKEKGGGIKRVSITGGDPLHPSHEKSVLELIKVLKEEDFYINIEASGARIVDSIFTLVDYISFDLKTPSTKVKTPVVLIEKMISYYPDKFQLKAVVQDREDFLYAHEVHQKLSSTDFPFILTPAYQTGESFPQQRFQTILDWNTNLGAPFRVIGQQHKWIFGSVNGNF